MMILTIRTDNPEAEIALYDGTRQKEVFSWQAHRQLAETIHVQIGALLERHGKTLQEVQGIVCYKGPGSFTGLRIGLTAANALAYALRVPIVGETTDTWKETGVQKLLDEQGGTAVLPEYGADVHITPPKR